jgi:peptidoglycan/LPS O-acetylase OafA/YrhL
MVQPIEAQGKRLPAFDALRGIAAIVVLFHHIQIAGGIFDRGYYAVDLFFVLSGFVVAQTYEPALAQGINWATFMRVRLERLYPMLLLGGLLGVLLFPTFVVDGDLIPRELNWPLALVSQFLMIPFLVGSGAFIFNIVQWSIIYEVLANGVHAAMLRYLSNWVLAAICGGSFVALVLAFPVYDNLSFGWSRETFVVGLARVGFGYFFGVLLQRTAQSWQRFIPIIPTWAVIAGLVIVLGAPTRMFFPESLQIVSMLTLLALVAIAMLASKSRGAFELSAELGVLSYPLYAIQTPLLAAIMWLIAESPLGADGSKSPTIAFGAVAICFLAWLIGRKIEQPLIKWRSQSAGQVAIRSAWQKAHEVLPER